MEDATDLWLLTSEPPLGIGRDQIRKIYERLVAIGASAETDALIFGTLDRAGSDRLLRVKRSVQYSVDGQAPHVERDSVTLCSRNSSLGYFDSNGETVYWAGAPPDFWDEWIALPQYTSSYGAALSLESQILGLETSSILQEERKLVPDEDDTKRVETTFIATIKDTAGTEVIGPVTSSAATALLAATLQYVIDRSANHVWSDETKQFSKDTLGNSVAEVPMKHLTMGFGTATQLSSGWRVVHLGTGHSVDYASVDAILSDGWAVD